MDADKLAEIFSDQAMILRVIDSIKRIDTSVSSIADKLGVVIERSKTIKEGVDEVAGKAEEGAKKANEEMEDLLKTSEKAFESIDKWSQTLKGSLRGLADDFAQNFGKITDGMRQMQRSPESFVENMLGKIPMGFGALAQVMLESTTRVDKFSTAGRQAFLAFEATGVQSIDKITQSGAALGQTMMHLEENFLASRQDVQAAFGALAQGGFKVEEAVDKAGFSVAGFGDEVALASLGLDKAFKVAAGTSANLAGTLSKDTGLALTKSIDLIKDMGLAAHGTGLTMQAFVGNILQVTSALRTQGSDARDLASAFFNMEKAFKGAVGTNVSAQRVSDMAGMALSGVGQFVSGMSEGMQGAIALEVARKVAVGGDKLDIWGAMRGMKTGFSLNDKNAGQSFESASAEAVYGKFGDIQNPDQKFRALMGPGGMNALMAEFMVRTGGQGFADPTKFKEEKENYEKQLKEVAGKEPLNTADYVKAMDKLQQVINAMGELTASLLSAIVRGIFALGELMANPFDSDRRSHFSQTMSAVGTNIAGSARRVGSSLADALGSGGTFLNSGFNLGFRELEGDEGGGIGGWTTAPSLNSISLTGTEGGPTVGRGSGNFRGTKFDPSNSSSVHKSTAHTIKASDDGQVFHVVQNVEFFKINAQEVAPGAWPAGE